MLSTQTRLYTTTVEQMMTQNLPTEYDPRYVAIEERSPKNRVVAVTLGCLAGYWGLHRFYTGKFWTGLLMLLTGGGFIIWWIIDALLLLSGRFKDSEGRVLGPPAKVLRHIPDQHNQGRIENMTSDSTLDDEFEDPLLADPLDEEFRKLEAQERR